jgi:hypothetical protein
MATVTLYEYDGETRHESGVSVNWRQVGRPVKFDHNCSFDEVLWDAFRYEPLQSDCLDWTGPWREPSGLKVYEVVVDDRPLYRAEVKE